MKYEDLTEHVRRGAALLDTKKPGWRELLRGAEVQAPLTGRSMSWAEPLPSDIFTVRDPGCVLCRLYGHYGVGLDLLGITDPVSYGFSLSFSNDRFELWDELARLWRAQYA